MNTKIIILGVVAAAAGCAIGALRPMPKGALPDPAGLAINKGREIQFAHPLPRMRCGKVQCGTYNNWELAFPGLLTTYGSDFGNALWDLRKVVWADRRLVFIDGRTLMCQLNWIRDHVHQMKGYRHWEHDLTSFLDFILDTQRADGQFYELIKQLDDFHWTFVPPDCRVLYPEDNQALVRLELEADIEYLMVEGCVQAWRVTGDDAWLRRALPRLEKGIDYMTSDPKRWDKAHGLCMRPYTIDTWDFTNDPLSGCNRSVVLTEPMAVMHGDNSGVFQAMNQLAWINERFGNAAKAAEWRKRAEELKANMFRHLWNGKFFCHQMPVNCKPLDGHERDRLSLSMAYALNRGILTQDQMRGVVSEYKSRRKTTKGFSEWFTVDPAYSPSFKGYPPGQYVNGSLSPFTAGELARGAFECGEEAYGWDILDRVMKMVKRDGGKLYFLYDPLTGAPQGRGPSAWGAAAVLAAVDEGLAGVQDLDTQYRTMRFAPRWAVTPFAEGRYLTGYEASHKTIDVRWTFTDKGFRYNLRSPAKEVRAHLLVPQGKVPRKLLVDGVERPLTVTSVGESRYVDALVSPRSGSLDFEVFYQEERGGTCDVADAEPASAVSWICPDEPFPEGIGKSRFYRHAFVTRAGLVRATGRWWIDDTGSLHLDGRKVHAPTKAVEKPVDLTAALKAPGRHVLAVEGKNLASSGGLCLMIDLQYEDGTRENVFTSEDWRCAKDAAAGWTSPGFDDSGWARARHFADVFSAPWSSLADMSLLALPAENQLLARVRAARDARAELALAAIAKETKPVCRVVYEKGKPYFDIGGRRFETTFYNCSEQWGNDNPRQRRQAAYFRDAGMHVYGIGVNTPEVWKPDGSIDFADAESKLRSVLSIDPEARFQFCIDTCRPPKWWCDANPDELIGYANGTPSYGAKRQYLNFVAPSFASLKWRRDMADYIGRLVRCLESTPYAKRIYAYRPDYGVHHEWHYYGFAGFLPDNGKAMTTAFRKWLERNYKGDVEALRRAWNDGSVTFATAELPSKEARLRLSAGNMRDPVKDRAAIDYERCHAEQVRDCLFAFNGAAKEACGGRALVGNYCGYFFGMPFPSVGFHLENESILDSPLVDFQCSPYVYGPGSRAAGNVQYARCLLEGLRRRGKLALLEADNVTTVSGTFTGHGVYTHSRSDDIALLARDFAQTLCWGCGYWYFDFGSGWYDAPEFKEFFKKIYPIRSEIKDCRSISEILVVGDYESVMFTNAGSSKFNDARTTELVNALGHTGVPFDTASIVDLASGALKDYKVYIFCNLHYHTPEKDRVVSGLRARGKTVLVPAEPLSADDLRDCFAKCGVHVWNRDPDAAVYANASCVALHCASPGEKTIFLPRKAKVTMLYPERCEFASCADRIVFTPSETGMSTTLFRLW